MDNMLQKIEETVAFLTSKGFAGAEFGVVLGTGLGAFIRLIESSISIPYNEVPHFAVATVEFHKGQLILRIHCREKGYCFARPLSLLRRL